MRVAEVGEALVGSRARYDQQLPSSGNQSRNFWYVVDEHRTRADAFPLRSGFLSTIGPARGRNRTSMRLRKPLLYPLSYGGSTPQRSAGRQHTCLLVRVALARGMSILGRLPRLREELPLAQRADRRARHRHEAQPRFCALASRFLRARETHCTHGVDRFLVPQ